VARGWNSPCSTAGGVPRFRAPGKMAADIYKPAEAQRVLGSQLWDVVVDFISFTPADLEARLALFPRTHPAIYLHQFGQRVFRSRSRITW